MKSLFTAFKGSNNTSFQLISHVDGDVLLLTNSFQGLQKDIVTLNEQYDFVYMFGIDKTLVDKVRIETCAVFYGETVYTGFNIDYLQELLTDAEINFSVSRQATKYLCNSAFYHMLKANSNAVFIHIPSIKGMSENLMKKLIRLCLNLKDKNI